MPWGRVDLRSEPVEVVSLISEGYIASFESVYVTTCSTRVTFCLEYAPVPIASNAKSANAATPILADVITTDLRTTSLTSSLSSTVARSCDETAAMTLDFVGFAVLLPFFFFLLVAATFEDVIVD